jgi:nucleoid DNA-binding protein
MNIQDQYAAAAQRIVDAKEVMILELSPDEIKGLAQRIIGGFFEDLKRTLTEGNPVDLYGVGQFTIVPHSAHTAYKSTTGVAYTVPPYKTLTFKIESAVKKAVKALPA